MSFKGDFAVGAVVGFAFTTRSASTGPATLSGTPSLRVWKAGSTTPSTAGCALTADYGGNVGHNYAVISTTADSTFYSANAQFDVEIAAGTVNAISVVGESVARFLLGNQAAKAVASVTGAVGSIGVGGITNTSFASNAIDAAALATDAVQEIRDAVWTKTFTELTGDPGATPTAADAQMLPYMAIRNRRVTDSSGGTDTIQNNAGSVILTATITDSGTAFTKGKYA